MNAFQTAVIGETELLIEHRLNLIFLGDDPRSDLLQGLSNLFFVLDVLLAKFFFKLLAVGVEFFLVAARVATSAGECAALGFHFEEILVNALVKRTCLRWTAN